MDYTAFGSWEDYDFVRAYVVSGRGERDGRVYQYHIMTTEDALDLYEFDFFAIVEKNIHEAFFRA